MPFQPEYSDFLRSELTRLDAGNATEKKRAQTCRSKIAAVCQAPYSSTYSKDLPEHYGAVSVTGRFRLFFKIHPEYDVVYFAWMNDETHIHASGAANDAYQEFRRKLDNSEIEEYHHVELLGEEFVFNGSWGNEYIYVEFNRIFSDKSTERANSSLTLMQKGDGDYIISSIEVSAEDKGLASELLLRTLSLADEQRVTVTYELFLISSKLGKSRYLLSKFGFELSVQDEDVELWVRQPKN